ncbi:MAG TPA: hypothetical protein PLD36_08055 [Bacteroidia bacterium]|nr:hypothetical protein [Bacteroidia bacterium]
MLSPTATGATSEKPVLMLEPKGITLIHAVSAATFCDFSNSVMAPANVLSFDSLRRSIASLYLPVR